MSKCHPDIEGCVWCGATEEGLADHHIIHRSQGGSDDPWNRLPLCFWHHNEVHEYPWKLNELQILKSLVGSQIWRWSKALAILKQRAGEDAVG